MSAPSFSVNERVLCYHGPLIYEAKVLKCEVWDETNTKLDTVGAHHFVHYKGWKQTCVSLLPTCRNALYTPSSRFMTFFKSFSLAFIFLQLGRMGPHGAPPEIQRGQPFPSEGPCPGASCCHFSQCLCLKNVHNSSWCTSGRRAT